MKAAKGIVAEATKFPSASYPPINRVDRVRFASPAEKLGLHKVCTER
jgi:hypothetical protein